jgi:hypothetical protein
MATNPSSFTVSATLGKVACTWTSSGGTLYRVYRKLSTGGSYRKVFEGDGSTFSFTDYVSNFGNSNSPLEYDYQVRAVDSLGSESSGVDDTATMPDLTSSNVQSVGALDHELSTSSGTVTVSNTYNNDTASIAVGSAHRYMHEERTQFRYDDRTKGA